MEWKPIAMAPRDGRWLIGMDADLESDPEDPGFVSAIYYEKGHWMGTCAATHWIEMPELAAPPVDEKATQE